MMDDLFVPPPVRGPRPRAAGSIAVMSLQHLYMYSAENTDFSFSWVDDTYVQEMPKRIFNGN